MAMKKQRPWTKPLLVGGVLLALLLAAGGLALAQSYTLSNETVDGGGYTTGTGGDYTLSGSAGQQDASSGGSGGDYSLTGGFWNPDDGVPTAVTLAGMAAHPADGLLLPMAAVVLSAVGLVILRMRDEAIER
jgi:hypothetical protein